MKATTFRTTGEWLPGAPPDVTPQTQAIDRLLCAVARCPGCRRKGLAYRPQHCGNRYRAEGKCPQCGAVAEF